MDHECKKCGSVYSLRENADPTPFCDVCCQSALGEILELVPMSPGAITYDRGVMILNKVQRIANLAAKEPTE